jgi:hypothetical protein
MTKIVLSVTAAAAIFTAASLFNNLAPANAQDLKMAQGIDVQVGHEQDQRGGDRRNDNANPTIRIGPGGVSVGQKRHCHTVTITEERPDGRRVRRTERRCDD